MRTRSSSNLPVESLPNPSTSNPKRCNHRRSKKPFILEESPVDTMADQRTMVELLRAPTEGYAEAIVVPSILAEQFELKQNLINMMTSDQFFRLEKDNPHDHIRWGSPSMARKKPCVLFSLGRILFPNSSMNSFPPQEQQIFQTSVVTTAMTAILKQFQATSPPASVKAVEEICVTCGAAAVNYNQGNSVYRPLGSGSLPSNTIANPKGELKAITTRSGIVLDGPSVPIPPHSLIRRRMNV
nr:reverse transcriptase domain-containing protein [Tanacetum cinerariifolium]